MLIAIKNLSRHKLRSLMTLLGAAMGISAFVSLTSVGNGFRSQLGDLIRSYNIDITVTSKGAALRPVRRFPFPTIIGSLN